ncbi:MAG: 30S ribosomal protein S3 [Deltaproteobacteria bacterium]|nr:30S ribosomal protein S3 [Deltaproteobacteria bacterium]
MGQKTHPLGFRLGVIKTWGSRWYARRDYGQLVVEDKRIRDYVKKKLDQAGVSLIEIERFANKIKLRIHTARPGVVIGKKGAEIENLRKELERLIAKWAGLKKDPHKDSHKEAQAEKAEGQGAPAAAAEEKKGLTKDIILDIVEVRKPEISAQLVAENIAQQLQRRVAFRRAMKKSMSLAFKFGAQGIKIHCAGRLGGAEMARREWYREGRVPLHTLRADVDYGFAEAKTTYGIIGVKVHIFKGEIMTGASLDADLAQS